MKRTRLATLAIAVLAGGASLAPAHAVPPTATPSPGYDARLQEQRAAHVRSQRRSSSRVASRSRARIEATSPRRVRQLRTRQGRQKYLALLLLGRLLLLLWVEQLFKLVDFL